MWEAVYTFGFIDDGTFTLKVRVTAMPSQCTCYEIPALQVNYKCTNSSETHLVADENNDTRRKTITIFATSKLSVHGLVHSRNAANIEYETPTGGFLAMPDEYLGTEYLIDSYTPKKNSAKLTISAIGDHTSISISGLELCHTLNSSRVTQTISLNSRESVFLKTCTHDSDITGTRVLSNNPISVVVGSQRVFIPRTFKGSPEAPSLIIEQLLPVSSWGCVYVVPPFHQAANGWEISITAFHTQARVDLSDCGVHQPNPLFIDEGNKFQMSSNDTNSLCIITTDHPVQVIQYMASSEENQPGDASMLVIPPVDDFHSNVTFVVTIDGSHVDITTSGDGVDSIRLDNQQLFDSKRNGNFIYKHMTINNGIRSANYCYYHTILTRGVHTVTHAAGSKPFLVRLYEHDYRHGAAILADITIPSGKYQIPLQVCITFNIEKKWVHAV